MQKKQMKIKRLVLNAMLIAVYFVLSMPVLAVQVGGGLKFTFEHFPVILSAVLFGPIDALLVGGLGELINQLTTFGLTPTTVLWILPIAFRGVFLGVMRNVLPRQMGQSAIVQKNIPVLFMVICVVSGIFASLLNTLALYVDSKLFGYYTYAMVFGVLLVRILSSVITSILMSLAAKPVIHALSRSQLIDKGNNGL